MTLLNKIILFISYNKYNFRLDLLMAYNLLIFMRMVEHLLQYLLIDLCQLQILSLLGIMVINVSIRNVLKKKRNSKRYRILLQLMLLSVQMGEYSLLIIVVSEIIILHLVVIYPIRQRTLNFHDQTACLKSKLIFNIQLVSH